LWMGREALGTAFNMAGAFNNVTLSLMPQAIEADVIFQLDRQLKQYGGFGAYARKDQLSNRFLSEEITQLQGTATYVPSIFLGIAAFLLHILLSRLISTQREQIAVLKAFGYSNVAIGWHYLKFLLAIVSIGMLVVGRYVTDAMQYMVDVQYRQVQRDDVTIVFNEPRPARVQYEVAHLPGVLRSELFRAVPVTLRFEHHKYRIALTGVSPQGELRRLLDRHLRPVDLPLNGVVLTTKLAEILGVQPGDAIAAEVLEGARPIRSISVAGLVDELMGVAAYMDIHALNELMRESGTVSGAYLAVDPLHLDRLYTLLKRTPAVAGVSVRATAIARFEETISGSMGIFTTVLVIFACIIAFGVIYNAARIALSERDRELATLRVIGFTQTEIAVILLGEQALLTLLAVPLGFAMGFGISALLSLTYNSELYRMPLIVTPASYLFAFIIVTIAAVVSGSIVHRQLARLDLIAVLKTRE
jgi:putative ABC transport system permease protein